MARNNSSTIKLVYIIWPREAEERGETQDIIINYVTPKILTTGLRELTVYAADPDSAVPSPAPRFSREIPACAMMSLLPGPKTAPADIEKIIGDAGYRCAGYRVEETIYREYGGNRHAGPRTWEDGVRSPGVTTANLLERPAKIPRDEWIERWYGTMSPVSEAMQPRGRYVRNLVLEAITPEAPPYEAIVFESWPSKKHLTNPFLFYGADGVVQLVKNLTLMLRTVTSFLNLLRIRSYPVGEYFMKSAMGSAKTVAPARPAAKGAKGAAPKKGGTGKKAAQKKKPATTAAKK